MYGQYNVKNGGFGGCYRESGAHSSILVLIRQGRYINKHAAGCYSLTIKHVYRNRILIIGGDYHPKIIIASDRRLYQSIPYGRKIYRNASMQGVNCCIVLCNKMIFINFHSVNPVDRKIFWLIAH